MWFHPKQQAALVFLFFYLLLWNGLLLYRPFEVFKVDASPALDKVQVLASDASTPPDSSAAGWRSQNLPDDWFRSHKSARQYWYRTSFELPQMPEQVWAVYLPQVAHTAAVYINGVWVGQAGRFSDPVSRYHNIPLLFRFAPELLRVGANRIELRVKASFHEQGFLDKFYIAPYSALYPAYRFKHFVRVDVIEGLTLAMYLMAFIVLAFWLARRQDRIYGFFSMMLFFWATHNLNLIVSEIPLSARLWEALVMSTLGWTVLTMIYFNHCFAAESHPRIERWALITGVLGVSLFFLPDIAAVLHVGYRIWDVLLALVGVYLIYFLTRIFLRQSILDNFLILLVGIPMMVSGLHDVLLVNHLIERGNGLIIQYSVFPALMLFSWFMLRRFVQSINQAEHLAAHLEQRVAQKTGEIQAQYEKLKQMESQSLLASERERMMRDMHDGIGGQLVSVITLLQDQPGELLQRIRDKVQHSLADLRMVIDSLDPLQNDVPVLLGTMRMRLHEQLDAADIQLEWAVTDLPAIADMSPRRSLHIMRIVQEAITNCIKHSGARKMKIATGVSADDAGEIYIDIIDFGKGFDSQESLGARARRGICNMRYRAEQIGARLKLHSSERGTRVRLLLATG